MESCKTNTNQYLCYGLCEQENCNFGQQKQIKATLPNHIETTTVTFISTLWSLSWLVKFSIHMIWSDWARLHLECWLDCYMIQIESIELCATNCFVFLFCAMWEWVVLSSSHPIYCFCFALVPFSAAISHVDRTHALFEYLAEYVWQRTNYMR